MAKRCSVPEIYAEHFGGALPVMVYVLDVGSFGSAMGLAAVKVRNPSGRERDLDGRTREHGNICRPGAVELFRQQRHDEPKLEIGDAVPIKDGIIGVVVARGYARLLQL